MKVFADTTSLFIVTTSLLTASLAAEIPQVQINLQRRDNENVMALVDSCQSSLKVLYGLIPFISQEESDIAFDEVKAFINYQGNDKKRKGPYLTGLSPYWRENALRSLEGNRIISTDWSSIACNDPLMTISDIELGTKNILARVWYLIKANPDRHNMEQTLYRGLNEGIEDDGHRTCKWGMTTRMLLALQGRFNGIDIEAEYADPREWCGEHLRQFTEKACENSDPISFIATLDVPEDFSFKDLLNRISAERGDVLVLINGYYGANSSSAKQALAQMESKFEGWISIYRDNATPNQIQEITLQAFRDRQKIDQDNKMVIQEEVDRQAETERQIYAEAERLRHIEVEFQRQMEEERRRKQAEINRQRDAELQRQAEIEYYEIQRQRQAETPQRKRQAIMQRGIERNLTAQERGYAINGLEWLRSAAGNPKAYYVHHDAKRRMNEIEQFIIQTRIPQQHQEEIRYKCYLELDRADKKSPNRNSYSGFAFD